MRTKVLCELFDSKFFTNTSDAFTLEESAKNAFVKSVTFTLPGARFAFCRESLWSASENLYAPKTESFEFRRKCDGFAICNHEGQKYLIWVELKSSFSEVLSDAIFQLSGCYVKAKSYLTDFDVYIPGDYKELGIVVSRPIDGSADERRLGNMNPISGKVLSRFRKNNILELRGSDFGSEKMHLSKAIQLGKLPVFHVGVKDQTVTVDLARILSQI